MDYSYSLHTLLKCGNSEERLTFFSKINFKKGQKQCRLPDKDDILNPEEQIYFSDEEEFYISDEDDFFPANIDLGEEITTTEESNSEREVWSPQNEIRPTLTQKDPQEDVESITATQEEGDPEEDLYGQV